MTLSTDSSSTNELLQRVVRGDQAAVDRLMQQHRQYLRRLVEVRMEAALCQRLDPSDVVQETLLAASQRIEDFLQRRPCSFRVWLRSTALERLVDARRRHQAQKRNLQRDLAITDASSMALAQYILGPRPSEQMARREQMERVRTAMAQLAKSDCEILTMRHAEELTNAEVADVLHIDPKTASKRYGRALRRLSDELARLEQASE